MQCINDKCSQHLGTSQLICIVNQLTGFYIITSVVDNRSIHKKVCSFKGSFCDTIGLSTVSGACAKGFYCTLGASRADPRDNITGNVCPRGSYCPVGTSVPVKCPPGRYSNKEGNQELADCELCDEGKYCDENGLIASKGNCSEGFYCPPGQNTSQPSDFR